MPAIGSLDVVDKVGADLSGAVAQPLTHPRRSVVVPDTSVAGQRLIDDAGAADDRCPGNGRRRIRHRRWRIEDGNPVSPLDDWYLTGEIDQQYRTGKTNE